MPGRCSPCFPFLLEPRRSAAVLPPVGCLLLRVSGPSSSSRLGGVHPSVVSWLSPDAPCIDRKVMIRTQPQTLGATTVPKTSCLVRGPSSVMTFSAWGDPAPPRPARHSHQAIPGIPPSEGSFHLRTSRRVLRAQGPPWFTRKDLVNLSLMGTARWGRDVMSSDAPSRRSDWTRQEPGLWLGRPRLRQPGLQHPPHTASRGTQPATSCLPVPPAAPCTAALWEAREQGAASP